MARTLSAPARHINHSAARALIQWLRERVGLESGAEERVVRLLLFAAFAALTLSAPAQAAPSAPGRLEFEVLRNGQPFGRHVVSVTQSANSFRVQSNVALRVGAGPLTLYRHDQTCSETWRDGALAGLDCSTLKEGRRTRVSAMQRAGSLHVTGAQGARDFPLDAWPTTWWTRPPTNISTMLNTETGAPTTVRVTRMGRETIQVGGASIEAERFRVQGTLTVDLWYDDEGRWVGCAFTARGQHVTYRLASPRTAGPA